MAKELIFAAEDETHIGQLIKYNLESAGFRAKVFENGESLLDECQSTLPDMFILDIMLPGIDGLEICRRLKQNARTKNIPIIMLTAKGEEFDRVLGLELGADDYIVKPFSVRELAARVRAVLRRTKSPEENAAAETIKCGELVVDCLRREVYKNGNLIETTLKEFELLKLLMQNKGRVLTREQLLEKIWGFDYYGETRTIDVHIRYLRQKIGDEGGSPPYIETVRGIGYKFNDRV